MEIENLPENVIYLKLPAHDPHISKELKELNETISEKDDCDVILDFSYVEIINSSNISNLLILRSFLEKHGRELMLYNVQTITRCIFVVAGLVGIFVFIDNLEQALKMVQKSF